MFIKENALAQKYNIPYTGYYIRNTGSEFDFKSGLDQLGKTSTCIVLYILIFTDCGLNYTVLSSTYIGGKLRLGLKHFGKSTGLWCFKNEPWTTIRKHANEKNLMIISEIRILIFRLMAISTDLVPLYSPRLCSHVH